MRKWYCLFLAGVLMLSLVSCGIPPGADDLFENGLNFGENNVSVDIADLDSTVNEGSSTNMGATLQEDQTASSSKTEMNEVCSTTSFLNKTSSKLNTTTVKKGSSDKATKKTTTTTRKNSSVKTTRKSTTTTAKKSSLTTTKQSTTKSPTTIGGILSVTTGSYFTIQNVGSGKYLNIYGNKSANKTNVDVYSFDGTSGQYFQFKKIGNSYSIIPQCAIGSALNVYGEVAQENSNVCLWQQTGHSTQNWDFYYIAAKGGFMIRSANNPNLVLTATGSANSSNVCLTAYNSSNSYQIWRCDGIRYGGVPVTTPTTAAGSIVSPVQSRKITSNFQPYYRQDYKNTYAHVGVDYKSNTDNLIIVAFYDGVVTKTAYNSSTGYYVEIKHSYKGKTFYSYYFHLKANSTLVSTGAFVKAGQQIATMGTTGDSTGVHLHFQLTSSSVVNANGTMHTPTSNSAYSSWSISEQSAVASFTSSRGIVFYNPEMVLTKGLSVIA